MTNVIVIGGRLTANANLTRTPNGSIICNFTIANNRKEANGEETTFMSVVIFGNYAEKMHPYLIKGVVVDVVGKLVQKEWIHEDKKIPIYKIYAKEIDFRIPKNKQTPDIDGEEQGDENA